MPIVAPSISLMDACILNFNYILVGWANGSIVNLTLSNPDAGRGLQPRPKRLAASITFETLNVKDGVINPVPLKI